jgi:hypothetical protein
MSDLCPKDFCQFVHAVSAIIFPFLQFVRCNAVKREIEDIFRLADAQIICYPLSLNVEVHS